MRELVEAWLLTMNCLLLLVEMEELFEGDDRLETLRSHRRERLAEQRELGLLMIPNTTPGRGSCSASTKCLFNSVFVGSIPQRFKFPQRK